MTGRTSHAAPRLARKKKKCAAFFSRKNKRKLVIRWGVPYSLRMSNDSTRPTRRPTRRQKLEQRLSLLRRSPIMGFPLTEKEIGELFEIKRKLGLS